MKNLTIVAFLAFIGLMFACETETPVSPDIKSARTSADLSNQDGCTDCKITNSNGWAGVQVFPNGRIPGEPVIRYFMDPEPESMEFCDDGTAHFQITAVNADDSEDAWLYDVWLYDGVSYADWISQENHFIKLGGGIPEELTETWHIYLVNPASKATGLGANDGIVLQVVHDPPDFRFGVQVGYGANGRNTGFGLWGWYALILEDGSRLPADWIFDVNCPPPPPDCGECDGKVSSLTLRYNGDVNDAEIVVIQKKDNIEAFNGTVQPGEQFSFDGLDKKGTLGTEIKIYVNGEENTRIHTSCSQPIGPGLVSGDFEVISGESRNGGELCPITDPDPDPDPDPEESCCDGKVSSLTLQYNGDVNDAEIVVIQKKDNIEAFAGTVQPGDQFSFDGLDKKGTLGTEIKIYVNGEENTRIHTSCSQPIGPGLVSGDFEVISGESRNGGELCPI